MQGKGKSFGIIMIALTFVTCAGFFLIAERTSKAAVDSMIEQQVMGLLAGIKTEVEDYNYSNFSTIHIAESLPVIKDPSVPIKKKAELLFGVKDADPRIIGLNITDLQGNSYLVEGPLYNFSERTYFKEALKGKEIVFGPIYNKVSNLLTVFYSSPLYDENGNIVNTLFLAAHGEVLSKICSRNKIGKDGEIIIVRRSTGIVIADSNEENVLKKNIFDEVAETGIKDLADLTGNIMAGESLFTFVDTPYGVRFANGFVPIDGTDWSVVVRVNYADFTETLNKQRIFLVTFGLIMLALGTAVSVIFIRRQN